MPHGRHSFWFSCVSAGAPARLVHQQLSTHLLGALQHQMQQAHQGGTAGGAQAAAHSSSGLSKLASHMQALGLGAVAAEVQEGQPGMYNALQQTYFAVISMGYLWIPCCG